MSSKIEITSQRWLRVLGLATLLATLPMFFLGPVLREMETQSAWKSARFDRAWSYMATVEGCEVLEPAVAPQ